MATRGPHSPPPLVPRGSTRRLENAGNRGGPKMASSPLLFLAGGDNHRYLQNEETYAKQQLILSFFFVFNLFSLICFSADRFFSFLRSTFPRVSLYFGCQIGQRCCGRCCCCPFGGSIVDGDEEIVGGEAGGRREGRAKGDDAGLCPA